MDYVLVRVEQQGEIRFATPLPGAPGALTGASNGVSLPASTFTKAGRATVRITAFSVTGLDADSIPGIALRSARHRTTSFLNHG